MRRNGVCYDAGREMLGQNWRPHFDPAVVRREIEVIHRDLHCNAVHLQCYPLDRLEIAASDALEEGLEVWLSPEMWDHPTADVLPYLGRAAGIAERLRRDHGDRVVLVLGTELSLFTPGFLPGANVLERVAHPDLRSNVRKPELSVAVNEFLGAAVRSAREGGFRGPLTYASLPFERVDWTPFDFVGADLYRDGRAYDRYPEMVRRYTEMGKPLANLELGCCTFTGAEQYGGRGWQVVDWSVTPPRLTGPFVYDQGAQAREVADLLRINDELGVDAAFVYTFVEPAGLDESAWEPPAEVSFDLDLPRYSLVKTLYGGRHGAAYPDHPWEPKESFRAVAAFYAAHPPASGSAPS